MKALRARSHARFPGQACSMGTMFTVHLPSSRRSSKARRFDIVRNRPISAAILNFRHLLRWMPSCAYSYFCTLPCCLMAALLSTVPQDPPSVPSLHTRIGCREERCRVDRLLQLEKAIVKRDICSTNLCMCVVAISTLQVPFRPSDSSVQKEKRH